MRDEEGIPAGHLQPIAHRDHHPSAWDHRRSLLTVSAARLEAPSSGFGSKILD